MIDDLTTDTLPNGTLNVLAVAAIGLVLTAPTAAAGGLGADLAPSETVRVTPEDGSDTMTFAVRVPLLGGEGGAAGPTSSCGGTGTASCTGQTWTLHGEALDFNTTVLLGSFATTTNAVTGLNGPSDGNVWETHCDWFGVFGTCTLHQHGTLFIGDDARHTGTADYDLCAFCDWTVTVENVH